MPCGELRGFGRNARRSASASAERRRHGRRDDRRRGRHERAGGDTWPRKHPVAKMNGDLASSALPERPANESPSGEAEGTDGGEDEPYRMSWF